jgi:hypothetical protein
MVSALNCGGQTGSPAPIQCTPQLSFGTTIDAWRSPVTGVLVEDFPQVTVTVTFVRSVLFMVTVRVAAPGGEAEERATGLVGEFLRSCPSGWLKAACAFSSRERCPVRAALS